MSDNQKGGEVPAVTSSGVVSAPAGVTHEPAPGHKGPDELNPGGVYDPNAAKREAEGGPGIYDSEAIQPAHWVQDVPYEDTPAGRVAYLTALRDEEAQNDRPDRKERLTEIRKEISRVEALVKKDDKAGGAPEGTAA